MLFSVPPLSSNRCKCAIASKSQKKFAILMISDGIERQELPVWSDLYEEKSHLLKENQLLYAVLQVDKKEEELQACPAAGWTT